ncbi:MAG: dimethylsulfoxide reductase subunit B [Chloroflexi bacterium]|nr:dimethylsulfoxide reductase subunit B [Chloroflexota bacterium]
MAKQLGFYFDASACMGCKTCQVACKDKNDLPVGVNFRRVWQYGNGSWVPSGKLWTPNNVFVYSVSVACNHCEKPSCAEVCPTGALAKRADGLVLVNADQCVGCRYCEWACPYGAPQFNEAKGVMTKCNGCEDLLAQGQNPACVDACPMRALEFGDIAELRAKHGNVNAIEPLPVATLTFPALVIKPHRHAQASGKGMGRIIDLVEEA